MQAFGNIILVIVLYTCMLGLALEGNWLGGVVGIMHFGATFIGANKRAKNAYDKLATTLMKHEELLEHCLQLRTYALITNRRVALAITNSRIIILKRGIFGGFKMQDFQWKNLYDVQISENIISNIFGARLKFIFNDKNETSELARCTIEVRGIATNFARKIYSIAQAEEQSWDEKRRIRDLENKRALAGGVVVQTLSNEPSVKSESNVIFDEINRAKQLLDQAIISDSEFQELKSKILSRNY